MSRSFVIGTYRNFRSICSTSAMLCARSKKMALHSKYVNKFEKEMTMSDCPGLLISNSEYVKSRIRHECCALLSIIRTRDFSLSTRKLKVQFSPCTCAQPTLGIWNRVIWKLMDDRRLLETLHFNSRRSTVFLVFVQAIFLAILDLTYDSHTWLAGIIMGSVHFELCEADKHLESDKKRCIFQFHSYILFISGNERRSREYRQETGAKNNARTYSN